jgi:UDP-MurNAc hydroxylase
MKFEFIGNACGIFYGDKGTKILCDPWINDGVFEGSWCHYPPLKTKLEDILSVDALYVSHLHPDHFDERTFHFRKNIPIIILDTQPNFLYNILKNKGYCNIILVKNDETIAFQEFNITMYSPFCEHVFHEAKIGNLIDSAIVFENKNCVAINFNDNTPTVSACEKLKKKFERIDLAMINYNAAGPYPSCFSNLSESDKLEKHKAILIRNYDHMVKVANTLSPSFVLPFAGAYVIGGQLANKNQYLGTSTWDECADYIKDKLNKDIEVVCLRENDIFDLSKGLANKPYIPIDRQHLKEYLEDIRALKYPYEYDELPDVDHLIKDIHTASKAMKMRMQKYGIEINTSVYINIMEQPVKIYTPEIENTVLHCSLDLRLLRRILDRRSHWNNAEIGCHIEFYREPDHYEPDLHTALQFFHL